MAEPEHRAGIKQHIAGFAGRAFPCLVFPHKGRCDLEAKPEVIAVIYIDTKWESDGRGRLELRCHCIALKGYPGNDKAEIPFYVWVGGCWWGSGKLWYS